jgi:hypothetical protein
MNQNCILISHLLLQNKTVRASAPDCIGKSGETAWACLRQAHAKVSEMPTSSIIVSLYYQTRTYYQNRKIIKYQGAYFSLVKPYLEHPPFFGLIAGGWAIANGVKDIYHTDLNHIRSLALLLGVLSIFIMYIFAAQIYGFKIGYS